MHLDVAARGAAVAANRAQHARLAAAAAGLVGEDVVDLVTAAALEAPHVGPLAVAILELDLGLDLVDGVEARVLLLGEAEVDERAMPGVAERHCGCFACQ